jgi:hypothetical protein
LALGLLVFRSTWQPLFPGLFKQWDVLLPFVVYFGQRRAALEGIVLSLIFAHAYSLFSSAPLGVFPALFLIIFTLSRLISYAVYVHQGISVFLLIFSLSVFARFLITWIAAFFDHGWPLFILSNWKIWAIILNAFYGWALFSALGAIDRLTQKQPRSNIELAEGEI